MGNIFWIIFRIFSLQPVIRQKMLEWARLRCMAALEKARGSRVITLLHRQETRWSGQTTAALKARP